VADADAAWMWYLPNAVLDAPYGQAYYYANLTVAEDDTPAVAYYSGDNQVDVYVNGRFVGTNANAGAISTASVTLSAGTNVIVLRATNWGSSAGVIFSLADGHTGATLLNTGNASQPLWAWSPCAGSLGAGGVAVAGTVAPVVPPPPAVNCSAYEPADYPYSNPFYTASGSLSGSQGGSFFAWSGGVAAVDPTAAFIWSSPGAVTDAPVDTAYYNATVHATQLTHVTIYASADNQVDVFLNGLFVGSNADWSTTATLSATLQAGSNAVQLRARNWGGSAGLIMTLLDEEGAVLLNTGSPTSLTSWSTSPCSELFPPVPPPPAFAPAPPGGSGPNSVACAADTPRAAVYLTAPAHTTSSGFAWADFSIVDASAAWIWNTPNAAADAPSAQAYFSATLTLAAPADVLLFFSADNSAEVSLNGTVVASVSDWSKVASVAASLPAGDTPLSVRAVNWAGPAGLVLTVRDAVTGAVLLNTGAANVGAWSWCGAPVTVDTLEVSTELSALTQQGGALSADAMAALAAAIALQTGVDADNVFVGDAYASGADSPLSATPVAAAPPGAGTPPAGAATPPAGGASAGPASAGPASAGPASGRRRRLVDDVSLSIVISGLGSNESTAQAVAAVLGSPTTLMRLATAAGVSSLRLATQPSVSARVASTMPPAPVLIVEPGVQTPTVQTPAMPPPAIQAPVVPQPPMAQAPPVVPSPPAAALAPGGQAPLVPPPVVAAQAPLVPPPVAVRVVPPPPVSATTPPPPVVAPTVLASAMTLSSLTVAQFTPAAQSAFVGVLATQLGVATSAITVTGVTAAAATARRHLLQAAGITVAFTVAAPSSSSVAAITAAIVAAPASSGFTAALNTQLVAVGAPATTGVVVAAAPVTVSAGVPPAAPPVVVTGITTSSHAVVAATPALAVLLAAVLALVQ
jgi:hypothetical protein